MRRHMQRCGSCRRTANVALASGIVAAICGCGSPQASQATGIEHRGAGDSSPSEPLVAQHAPLLSLRGDVRSHDEPRPAPTQAEPPQELASARTSPTSERRAPPAAAAAPVELLEPHTYEFGEVKPGQVLPIRVRLRNTSDSPLAIRRIIWRSGTTPSLAAVISPGETYEFEIDFRAPRRSGEVSEKRFAIVFDGYAPLMVGARLSF